MTVQTNTNVASFNGDGANKVFPIGYKFNSAADLVVLLVDDVAVTTQILTLNSDFTVTGAGDDEGGTVTLEVAPTANQRLTIIRIVDILQLTDLRNQGKFYAEIHEDAFDLLTMIAQQHQSDIALSLRVAETDPEPARIPSVAQRAGKLLAFDASGNPTATLPAADSSTELRQELADGSSSTHGSALVGHRGSNVRIALDRRAIYADTLSSLKALSVAELPVNQAAHITTTGRAGLFVWRSGDQSANVSADPQEGVWVASDSDATGASGAWLRQYSSLDGVDVNWFGANKDGVTNDGPYFTAAVSYAKGRDNRVSVPAGTYLVENEVVLPGGMTISGTPTESVNNKPSVIIHGGTTSLFTTDPLDTNFNGLSISHFRVKGGVTNKWCVESHYPFTSILGIHVEDVSPRYLGNGFRLHNDGGQSSMGCWNSRLKDCRAVLDEDSVNPRTGFDLFINGGDVVVESCQTTFPQKGFFLRKGEAIEFRECGTNKTRDYTSVSGNITNAAFVIGDGTNGVKAVSIRGCYVEGHARAVLVNANVTSVSIKENYITDIKFSDPQLASDGAILLKNGFDGVSIDDNYIAIGYSQQSLVRSLRVEDGTTAGWTHKGNRYVINRQGFPYNGTEFPVDPDFSYSNLVEKIIDTGTVFFEDTTIKSNNGSGVINEAQTITLFSVVGSQAYDVLAWQTDGPSLRTAQSIVIGPDGRKDLLTSAGWVIGLSGGNVTLTNTSGANRAYRWTATRRN